MIEIIKQTLNLCQTGPMNLPFCILWILEILLFRDNHFGGKTFQVGPGQNPQDKLQCLHHKQVKPTAWNKNKQQNLL